VESVAGNVADVEIAPDADAVIEQTSHFRPAPCEFCGGILKPEIVYFGENVPRERVDRAFALVDDADALLVAGSSLTVMSGLRFVRRAAKNGQPVVIINRGPTRGDDLATVKLDSGTSETLAALADELA
jgi:NAD-dependent SIR2 family protein deacetylase